MQDDSRAYVVRELNEIAGMVSDMNLSGDDPLHMWATDDLERVKNAVENFDQNRGVAVATAAHSFAARLDSIVAAASVVPAGSSGTGGVGAVLGGWWNALKAKVQSLLSQVWNLIASRSNVADWTLTGEVGVSVIGLTKASIAIKFQ